jgi:hypothetical protein
VHRGKARQYIEADRLWSTWLDLQSSLIKATRCVRLAAETARGLRCVIGGCFTRIFASVVIEELPGLIQSECSNEAFEDCHTFGRREGCAGATHISRSIAALCLFSVAAVVALKYPLLGLGICAVV